MATRKIGQVEISQEAYFAGKMVCPNCGDAKFGSISFPDGTLIRTCHGHENDETACRFKWPSTDDHKYFHLPLDLVLRIKGGI